MMDILELKRFANAVALLDQVGNNTIVDSDEIELILNLAENEQFQAIETLFNTDENVCKTANCLMIYTFNINIDELNALADEHGFSRV